MLYEPKPGKLFQIILTMLVPGMTSACESDAEKQALIKETQIKVLKCGQRALAAETRLTAMTGKLGEPEKAKSAAITAQQSAERQLDKVKGDVTFHTTVNVISFGLIIGVSFASLHQGEWRKKDNDAIRKANSVDAYMDAYARATEHGSYEPGSTRS